VTGVPAFDLSGNHLAQAPSYKVSLSAEYLVHLDDALVTLRAESNWSDRVYFTAFNRREISQAPVALQNAYVTYEPTGDHWRVTAYVKNIGDKTVRASANVATTLIGSPLIGFLQPPRTFGLTAGYRF
jgi:iron complex outermembrane receptor protein